MKRSLCRESTQIYRNRADMSYKLSKEMFDALNNEFYSSLPFSGCLDALDEIPSGCMQAVAYFYDAGMTIRGKTKAELDEQNAFASRLINEILAEEQGAN